MIIGTVMGAWGTIEYGPTAGLLIGAGSGLIFSMVHALATVTFKVDHIVSGVVINVVAIGLARFLAQLFFGQATQSNPGIPDFDTIGIPLLSDLPGSGTGLRGHVPRRTVRVPPRRSPFLRPQQDALRSSTAFRRREPGSRTIPRCAHGAA